MHPLSTPPSLPPLQRGDPIRVVAPSGAFDRLRFFRGLSFLAEHFRVLAPLPAGKREGFLSASRSHRLQELNLALGCPRARAVVAARGGVGATDLLGAVDLGALRTHPKWLIGYSDVTALHSVWQALGLPSLHADNVTGLAPADGARRQSWLEAALDPYAARALELEAHCPGLARGPLVGGNLAVLAALSSQSAFLPPPGSILFLEEIAEAPYRIHRTLRQLEAAGVFARVAALLVGDLVGCGKPGEALALFAAAAARARIPCLSGLPSGHGTHNLPLTLGSHTRIDGNRVFLNAR